MAERPKILFLHRNTLGQFEFFGAWLAQSGWDVTFAMGGAGPDQTSGPYALRFFPIPEPASPRNDLRHPLEFTALNAAAAANWMCDQRDSHGYAPDIVVAHVGWGLGLCVKQVWPHCRYVAYHEWFYTDRNWARGGKIERPVDVATMVVNRLRTLPITAEFDSADANWCPTQFQADRFPPPLRPMIDVVPDGVDCAQNAPDASLDPSALVLGIPEGAPLLTYATRGMEPVRGFPQFMRALSMILARRPELHALVVADDKVAYGAQLPPGQSWGSYLLHRYDFPEGRLHLSPLVPRAQYQKVLQASSAHFYFTEPFVTSWSLSEALATGCLVIGSLTGPVEELIDDMQTGILVDMDDPEEVADMVDWVMEHPAEVAAIRQRARQRMLDHYDARQIFPAKEARLRALLAQKQ